jgi:hypothetical protein
MALIIVACTPQNGTEHDFAISAAEPVFGDFWKHFVLHLAAYLDLTLKMRKFGTLQLTGRPSRQ